MSTTGTFELDRRVLNSAGVSAPRATGGRFRGLRFGAAAAFSALLLSPVLGADYANVTVGPARLSITESAPGGIVLERVSGIERLMVEPKIGTFTGLTYKFGVKLSDEDRDRIDELERNRRITLRIRPASDDNRGRSFVDSNFRTTRKNGTSFSVNLDPSALGQSTSGTVKVKRLADEDGDKVFLFEFSLTVRGLGIVEYDEDGVQRKNRQVKGPKSVRGKVRVTL